MNVLELAYEIGLNPKRYSSTNGGEYKSLCPGCKEGEDRFCIWPKEGITGRYWCRVCERKGDAIQFCKDFLGLSYLQACKRLRVEPKRRFTITRRFPFKEKNYEPKMSVPTTKNWQTASQTFIDSCYLNLSKNQKALGYLSSRGFDRKTIEAFKLGWNPNTQFDDRPNWGLPNQTNENGRLKKQWLPKGIVIPSFEQSFPIKIKIRRSEWHEKDSLPKYVEVSGGLQKPSLFGCATRPIIIVESELDAILIQQFASDLCCCLALGGVGKKPDQFTDELLRKAPLILLALDYDEVGKKAYAFWMSQYPNLRLWPPLKGKSPGDSYQIHKVDLRKWILDAYKISIY